MKVLIVGGGGREHTLTWKISQSPLVDKLFCAPGNAGIAQIAQCEPNLQPEDIEGLLGFAKALGIDLTVVGPEDPLAAGIVDRFEAEGLLCFGPSQDASIIETKKAWTREFMRSCGIPGPAWFRLFTSSAIAKDFIRSHGAPIVVKASGLAKGKGVTVANTVEEACAAVDDAMVKRVFGDAGEVVVIEECLVGEEASVIVLTDGKTIWPLAASQDHKPVFDGDRGPNTGGMGAYAPAPVITPKMMSRIEREILYPTIQAMDRRASPYKGALYVGLMITDDGPKVLEFNCRFGDPENQVQLPLLKTDLVELMLATCEGRLHECMVEMSDQSAVCVVLASGGYPGPYEKGKVITGLEDAERMKDVVVFHAGTARRGDDIVTSGGRVLGVTALGDDIASAIDRAYEATAMIHFEGMQYRRDIGHRALARLMQG